MKNNSFALLLLTVIASLAFPLFNYAEEKNDRENPLTVRHFGAVGDGKTDDTKAILSAFEAVKDGGTLTFGKGTFIVSGLHEFKNYKNCVIDASGAVIKNRENTGSFWFQKSEGITWRGGLLSYVDLPHQENAPGQHPLYFMGCRNVRVENVHVDGSSFMGIVFNNCRYVWIVNNQVSRTLRDGIHLIYTQDFFILGNHVSETEDDAIAINDYGSGSDLRSARGIIDSNIVENCMQGVIVTNGMDLIISNNNVENTVFSGCQVTTNDRMFSGDQPTDGEVRRVKIIGNRFISSGSDLILNGRPTKNNGQITTGNAAIIVAYIDREDGWIKEGEKFFSLATLPSIRFSENSVKLKGDLRERFPTGRRISLKDDKGTASYGRVAKTALRGDETEVWLELEGKPKLKAGIFELGFGKILTDVEIINNEIYDSAVNGIHASSVFRLRIVGNKVFNCNRANSQWTGTIVKIEHCRMAEFRNNWIVEEGVEKLHKTPFAAAGEDVISDGNFIR